MASQILRKMCLNLTRKTLQNASKNINKQLRFRSQMIEIRSTSTMIAFQPILVTKQQIRHKSKRKQAKAAEEEEASDEEEEEEDGLDDFEKQLVDKQTRIFDAKVNSLRLDVILKNGLSIARNKVEEAFFDSRIRINGKKIYKKSEEIREGDEVDVVKGIDINNPKFLTVARVELLAVSPKGDGYKVKLRRCKALTIDNYEDPWSP